MHQLEYSEVMKESRLQQKRIGRRIQCPVCTRETDNGARVKRKRRTRETEAVAASAYSGLPVIGICTQPTQQNIQ